METVPPIVKFTSLQKRYGVGPVILDAINLTVAPHDFISFIGPSGCGKSTILKLVSGLSPGSTGELTVMGVKPREARDRQAFIFQDATLLPWLTAQLNVELPCAYAAAPRWNGRRPREKCWNSSGWRKWRIIIRGNFRVA